MTKMFTKNNGKPDFNRLNGATLNYDKCTAGIKIFFRDSFCDLAGLLNCIFVNLSS